MLLKINDRTFEIDGEQLRSQIIEQGTKKLADFDNPMVRQAAKGAVNMILWNMGVERPEGKDTLAFGVEVAAHFILKELEETGITLTAKEVS